MNKISKRTEKLEQIDSTFAVAGRVDTGSPDLLEKQKANPVNQIIRSKRKTLALVVKPDGSVIVRAPLRMADKLIWEFVEKNRQWIEKHQARVGDSSTLAPRQYIPGEIFMYLGNTYPLEIVREQKQTLLLDEKFRLSQTAQGHAGFVFEHWYRDQARRILPERVHLYAREFDIRFEKIRITSARTRWGSCSKTGSLNFSWRLIMAPLEVVDYVVVHELVHTVVFNHSRQFWQQVAAIMPDYKERRDWLKTNGYKLVL